MENLTSEELELIRKARADYQKKYYEKNKEKLQKYYRDYRANNKEKLKDYNKRYWLKKIKEA